MPYGIFKTGTESEPFCVYKVDGDEKRTGESLGCHSSEEQAHRQIAAIEASEKKSFLVPETAILFTLISSPWETVATKKAGKKWILEVLGVPFGNPQEKDRQRQYFSERTEIAMNIGDKRPVYYFHGDSPLGKQKDNPPIVGTAEYTRKDSRGHWFTVVLDQTKQYADRIWKAAIQGVAKASSGAINYLTRLAQDGEILHWPVGELTLLDVGKGRIPVDDRAIVSLKAAFDELGIECPEAFVKTGEVETFAVTEDDDESALIEEKRKAIVLGLMRCLISASTEETNERQS